MNITVQQLRNSDERVFKSVVETYWTRLHKFAKVYVIDGEIAKEIAQDTLLVLWRKRKDLDDDTCIINYLMVICRNKCLTYLRSLQLETIDINDLNESATYQRSNIYVLEDESLEILITKDLTRAIESSLSKLSSRTKEIFLMSRREGLKNREIAERQNINIKTVEFHINKALIQLRHDLSKDYYLSVVYFLLYILSKK